MSGSLRKRAEDVVRDQFVKGMTAGVLMTLDHIEGKQAGGVPYDGPLPDELRAYIATVRGAVEAER